MIDSNVPHPPPPPRPMRVVQESQREVEGQVGTVEEEGAEGQSVIDI